MQVIQPAELKPFGTNPCGDGYEVICNQTGHPVTKPRSLRSANGIAQNLNRLHASGDRKAFARALGVYGD
jgi:hypothetical protein